MKRVEAAPADQRRQSWSDRWSDPGFAPPWLEDDIPDEIAAAQREGLFPPDSALLDIGCGRGNVAAFFADRGHIVTGIDFAEPAIVAAHRRFGKDNDRLRFRTLDFCADISEIGMFDGALDRGCLHSLPPDVKPSYVSNLATCLRPGGNFLLMHKRGRFERPASVSFGEVETDVTRLFSGRFDMISTTPIVFGSGDRTLPGIAFRMRRHAGPAG